MRIGVVIPTIPGREDSLDRCLESYGKTRGVELLFQVYPDSPCSGAGWKEGAAQLVEKHGEPDYLHLTNDDCEALRPEWWRPAVSACDKGKLPAPIVRNTDGSLQSAGGDMSAGAHLLTTIQPDWTEVGFTTIPFLSWEQWKQIGMLYVHYASDVWVSHRGRQLGIPTVLRHGYEIAHHMHPVGRGAGMSQGERDQHDWAIVRRALAAP
jgi:hypothetical protein